MEVLLTFDVVEAIRQHGEAEYPDECCGFLIGAEPDQRQGPTRTVVRTVPAINTVEAERRRRFVIPPEELRRVEELLEPLNLVVVGFYHSHPDHPARPSSFDRDHAWPWYTYLVLEVRKGKARRLGAFNLEPQTQAFEEVPWRTPLDVAACQ
ncbi:MAG: M67 family metallopeptidase [Thermoplasmata archaeon]